MAPRNVDQLSAMVLLRATLLTRMTGEEDGEVRLDPDEGVTSAIRTVFERFTEFGSVRRVWLWFRSEQFLFPFRRIPGEPIQWVKPTYLSMHHVLSNPVYAGVYTYGKTRRERYLDVTSSRRGSPHWPAASQPTPEAPLLVA